MENNNQNNQPNVCKVYLSKGIKIAGFSSLLLMGIVCYQLGYSHSIIRMHKSALKSSENFAKAISQIPDKVSEGTK